MQSGSARMPMVEVAGVAPAGDQARVPLQWAGELDAAPQPAAAYPPIGYRIELVTDGGRPVTIDNELVWTLVPIT